MKGVWFILKIHIVQKGDTLWELSKKYGVDFEELKAMNSQLSSPDMIMPGMKIKIPGDAKSVKKETVKQVKKEEVKQPYVDMSPKPMPVIKEDDTKLHQVVKPEMPVPSLPQMPIMDQDINQYTTINFQQMPYPMKAPEGKPKQEIKPKQEMKPPKQEIKKEVKKEVKQPIPEQKPVMEPMHQPMMEPMHYQMPMYHHPIQPCCPPMIPIFIHPCPPSPCHHHHHRAHPHGGFMAPQFMPPHQGGQYAADMSDCGCGSRELVDYYPANTADISGEERFKPIQPLTTGQTYPPQFERQKTDGITYPKPPMFPQFNSTNNNHESE